MGKESVSDSEPQPVRLKLRPVSSLLSSSCASVTSFRHPSLITCSSQRGWCSRRRHWARSTTCWAKTCTGTRKRRRDWPLSGRKYSNCTTGNYIHFGSDQQSNAVYILFSFLVGLTLVFLFSYTERTSRVSFYTFAFMLFPSDQTQSPSSPVDWATTACRERARQNKTTTWYSPLLRSYFQPVLPSCWLHSISFSWTHKTRVTVKQYICLHVLWFMGLACVDVLSLEGSYSLDLHSHLVECPVERYLMFPSSSATQASLFWGGFRCG